MSEIGTVYGEALYKLACEEDLDRILMQQLDALSESFTAEPAFLRLLNAPSLSKAERCRILNDCFQGKILPYLLNFLKILTEKGYMHHFPDCVKAYREYHDQNHGILTVTAVTAVAVTDRQKNALTGKLKSITGKQITLVNRTDPGILGGVRLEYDGRRLDDTVAHRLDSVRNLLQNTLL